MFNNTSLINGFASLLNFHSEHSIFSFLFNIYLDKYNPKKVPQETLSKETVSKETVSMETVTMANESEQSRRDFYFSHKKNSSGSLQNSPATSPWLPENDDVIPAESHDQETTGHMSTAYLSLDVAAI